MYSFEFTCTLILAVERSSLKPSQSFSISRLLTPELLCKANCLSFDLNLTAMSITKLFSVSELI